MQQLFLTSSVNEVAHDIATKIDAKNKKLVFIDTAAEVEEGDKTWLREDRQALADAGFLVTDYTITDKTRELLNRDLAGYDAIYVSGGNTFYLLQQAQLSGFLEVIRDLVLNQEKMYIGASAGSIIAGPDAYPTLKLDNAALAPKLKGYKSFGLVNYCILPHWGTENFKKRYEVQMAENYQDKQFPLIALTDSQYVWARGKSMEIIDVRREVI